MADIELTMTMTPWDRVQPLIAGEVKPEGIRLRFTELPLSEIWRRQLEDEEFDLSEISFSYALKGIPAGWGYRLLPVFHNRTFSYVGTVVRVGSGIRPNHPEDLVGKRVGVTDYQQTASLWTLGILRHEFGVDPASVEWFQGARAPVIPGTSAFAPPPGIHDPSSAQRPHRDDGPRRARRALHRPRAHPGPARRPRGVPFAVPGRPGEAARYFAKTGVFPTHHATALRESIAREHPWAAASLLDAFTEAQRIVTERTYRQPPSALVFARGHARRAACGVRRQPVRIRRRNERGSGRRGPDVRGRAGDRQTQAAVRGALRSGRRGLRQMHTRIGEWRIREWRGDDAPAFGPVSRRRECVDEPGGATPPALHRGARQGMDIPLRDGGRPVDFAIASDEGAVGGLSLSLQRGVRSKAAGDRLLGWRAVLGTGHCDAGGPFVRRVRVRALRAAAHLGKRVRGQPEIGPAYSRSRGSSTKDACGRAWSRTAACWTSSSTPSSAKESLNSLLPSGLLPRTPLRHSRAQTRESTPPPPRYDIRPLPCLPKPVLSLSKGLP